MNLFGEYLNLRKKEQPETKFVQSLTTNVQNERANSDLTERKR